MRKYKKQLEELENQRLEDKRKRMKIYEGVGNLYIECPKCGTLLIHQKQDRVCPLCGELIEGKHD